MARVVDKGLLAPATDARVFGWLANNTTGYFLLTRVVYFVLRLMGYHVVTDPTYGATGDGVTDDTAAIQAAIDAANGGAVVFPAPTVTYKTTAPLVPKIYTTFRGTASLTALGTQYTLTNTASAVFDLTGASSYWCSWRNLSIHATGGDAIAFGAASGMEIERCSFVVDAGFSAISSTAQLLDSEISRCYFTHGSLAAPATVPTVYLVSNANAINTVAIRRCRFTYSGNYSIWIENTATGGYCADNVIEGVNFEGTAGGAVMLLSAFGTEIRNCAVYDLTIPTTKDLIVIGRSDSSHLVSRYNKISHFYRRGGSLGASLVDIRLQSGVATHTTIEHSDSGTLAGFVVDLGSNATTVLRDMNSAGVTFLNVASSLGTLVGSKNFNWPSLATATEQSTTVSVTGAALGDVVTGVSLDVDLQGTSLRGYVSAANTVTVYHRNDTGGPVDLASALLRVEVLDKT